jgi:hypothetical protein
VFQGDSHFETILGNEMDFEMATYSEFRQAQRESSSKKKSVAGLACSCQNIFIQKGGQ